MALVKMIGEDYPDRKDLQNLVQYIIQPDKAVHGLVGGFGLLPAGEEEIIRQMETVKEVWHKTGGRQARHFVVSFAWGEHISEAEAWRLAYWIALYYADRYQIVYAVHEDTENLHIHFVFNPVSFVDGRIYAEGKDDLSRLEAHIWLEMNTGIWRERDREPRNFLVNGKFYY